MTGLLVCLGAALGAVVRFLAGRYLDDGFPVGILIVNVAGSFLLGAVVGAGVGGAWGTLLGVGFCGGLTTYSTFAVQGVRLTAEEPRRGLGYIGATVVLAIAAATLGHLITAGGLPA